MEAEQQAIEYAITYNCQLLEQEIRDVKLWGGIELPSFNDMRSEWSPAIAGRLSKRSASSTAGNPASRIYVMTV